MKKKSLLTLTLLIIVFASASFVSADFTKIYDKWQSYDTSFTVDNILYRARISTTEHDQMVLRADGINYLIYLEECKEVGAFSYCYENKSYDRSEATIADDGNLVPAVKLVIWEDKTLSSSIQVKHQFEAPGYEIKEIEMEVILTNKGTTTLEDSEYTIFIPGNITITNQGTFIRNGNLLTKKVNLGPGKTLSYKFRFIPKEYGAYNFNYNYNYTAGTIKTVKGTVNVAVNSPYELVLPNLAQNYDVTDSVRFPVIIKNKHPSSNLIIKKITITGPPEYDYGIGLSKLTKKTANVFEGQAIIQPNSQKDFALTMYPVYSGTFRVFVDLDMELEGKPLTLSRNVTIKSDIKDFSAKIYFDKSNVLPGETVKLIFYYYNSHFTNSLKGADVTVNSSLFRETFTIGEIPPGSQDNLLLKTFEIPPRERDEKAQFRAELKFKTESGQIIRKNYTETLSIAGSGKILQLTQKVNKKTASPDDEIIVEVSAKNLRDQSYQDVIFQELYPEGTTKSGEVYKKVNFLPLEDKLIYIYKLYVPQNYEFNKFNITSTAKIESLLYETSASTVLTINGTNLKPLPTVNNEEQKNTSQENITVTQPEEKNPNFFVRVFKSIENFFTNLFSKGD